MLTVRSYIGFTFVALIGLSACAKQMPPPGGPRDTTPPQIDSTIPPSGTTQIAPNAAVTIAFSESMQRDEVERSLSIFPAPEHPPELRWKGSSLIVTPDTAWDLNQTYVMTLQADARDRRGNLITHSLQVAFSTGTSIDSGVIRGTILSSGRTQQGAMALCYRLGGEDPNPESDTADYLVQTDSAGQFTFSFLAPGSYRVYGLDDRDRDWLWYVGSEPIGVPSTDIQLAGPDTVTLPPLSLTPLDTVTPAVADCRAISPNCIQVSFDAPLDSALIADIRVTPLGHDSVQPALYGLDSQITQLYVVFGHALDTGAHDLAIATPSPDAGGWRYDTCTARIPDTWDTLFQPVRAITPDTIAVPLAAADLILLQLRAPLTTLATDTLLWSSNTDTGVAAKARLVHPFAVAIDVPKSLLMTDPLEATLPPGFMQDAAGRTWPRDSAKVLRFRFPHLDSSGDFEVQVTGLQDAPTTHRLGLSPARNSPYSIWRSLDSNAVVLGYLVPGSYYLELHHDRDGNLRRDPGWPYPIRFSEPVWRVQDSLVVRARFTTELLVDMTARK